MLQSIRDCVFNVIQDCLHPCDPKASGCLFQSSGGNAVRIFLALTVSSNLAMCPNKERCRAWIDKLMQSKTKLQVSTAESHIRVKMRRSYCRNIRATRRHSWVRSHADNWLHHLADGNEARTKNPWSCRRLVTPPSEWRWIAILVCKMDLLTLWPWPFNPKTVPLLGYPKVISYTKFEHFRIIHFWVMDRTNRQTNRRTRTFYPRRPT